jgi:hypothetical protein
MLRAGKMGYNFIAQFISFVAFDFGSDQIALCIESSWHVALWQQVNDLLSVYCCVLFKTSKQND